VTAPFEVLPAPTPLPDSFFHTRDNPWYGCGTKLDNPASAREALQLAGLDWSVAMRPLIYQGGTATRRRLLDVPNRFVTTRTDTDAVLGIVGTNYKVFQNRDAFALADTLVADGGLVFDSAGSYNGGRRIFLVARLPETIQVIGGDPYGLYLMLLTAHDGTMSITAVVTHVRLACTNMIGLALREAKTRWTIRHTATAEGRIQEAREALALTFKADDAFKRAMDALAVETCSDNELRAMLRVVMPERPSTPATIETIVGVRRDSPNLEGHRGSRYGALQAHSEWLDWGRQTTSADARFQVSFEGYGARQRNRLHGLLAA
jgi:phage/plasmid-like protein (TIGR03299 family)